MTLQAYGLTDVGPVRGTNEDCFVSVDDLRLFVVADGMGGHAAGEVASQVAVESIEQFIRRSRDTSDGLWPFGIDTALSHEGNRLRTAVCLANRRLHDLAGQNDDYVGMGTTVVCALVCDDRVVVANVGDSRLYLFDGEAMAQLTQDDSWAALLAAGGREPPAVARTVLTNVLGARPDISVHVLERQLTGGETLLLCTDGVHGVVPDEAIRGLLSSSQGLPQLVESLLRAALDRGSRDNITALAVRYLAH